MGKIGQVPWNKGLTKDIDPRVKKYGLAGSKTIKKQYLNGRVCWIKGRTKETEPAIARLAVKNSQRTKEQYLRTGREKWMKERKNFTRKGKKNRSKQKDAARKAIFKTISSGKLFKYQDTKIEKIMESVLINQGIVYKKQKHILNITIADFYIPIGNLIIFCDGDYWHNLLSVITRDARINKELKNLGYQIIRFPEKDILNHIEKVKEKLTKIMI